MTMPKCPICGTAGGYQGLREFACAQPGCQNYVSLDVALELIDSADESEFECDKTEPIIVVPSSGWVDTGGI